MLPGRGSPASLRFLALLSRGFFAPCGARVQGAAQAATGAIMPAACSSASPEI
jgi:hypothetical protein